MSSVTNGNSTVSTGQSQFHVPLYTTPINFGTIQANVGSTATQPGVPQQSGLGLSNAVDLADNAKTLYNWFSPSSTSATSGIGTDIAKGLGDSGSSSLGIGSNYANADTSFLNGGDITGKISDLGNWDIGNLDFGSSDFWTSTPDSFASGIASAGAGFVGTKLGSWITGGGGYSNVGGTIGSVAGAYFGGPVGSFIGSTIGSAVGGLFGGGTPHPAAYFADGELDALGNIQGGQYDSKHMDTSAAQGLKDSFGSYLKSQAKKYGVSYNNDSGVNQLSTAYDPGVYGGATPANLGWYNTGTQQWQNFSFDPNNTQQTQQAYQNAFNYIATQSGYDPSSFTEISSPTNANNQVTIAANNTPSDWDTFLAKYRSDHTTSTTTS